ncbi:MAG: 3-deoxy-manno-octulosonate cytidylyltransferase [Candidatus Omnitrophica bacterium]|nr:3-deoxy-manno-octulosonate cytidylyltransferase [Candidatus Omnitrophota bacterium]
MKIIGVVPARMAASRFPGKPLYPICGKPMVEHVFCRAAMFPKWDGLYLATCDQEIFDFGKSKGWPTIMTSDRHTRALDRVAEAAQKCGHDLDDQDIVVCVQGDEPMLHPDMITAVVRPLEENKQVHGTVLSIAIADEEQFKNPDIVKIIHNIKGDVLYTSRLPIPYCKKFSLELGARRIGGIFGFRWHFLKTFTGLPESPLELKESCDSNRFLDHGYHQRIAPYPCKAVYSIDSPADVRQVEQHMKNDPLWGSY